ncbi:hypothetical protein PHMEG_00031521 [Phytophthora megakarya]|uniref:Uncharacterized protein n=1 Tax=Phytophthora megakarya TaxID=4795 RepID=A0A225UYM9_9STRA|nr:hypothetical protein PHMEG_00031521 [Phytophthora megakarya]
MRSTPAERYLDVFPLLRTGLFRTLHKPNVSITRKKLSVLWVAMWSSNEDASDANRHNLAKALMVFTDGEMRTLGTVRISLQGKWNANELEASKTRMDEEVRGSWELVAAVDKKLSAHLHTPYEASVAIAPNAGYIVYRNKQTVVFYTNDLAGTPSARALHQMQYSYVEAWRIFDAGPESR